jgi:hypothetical protein
MSLEVMLKEKRKVLPSKDGKAKAARVEKCFCVRLSIVAMNAAFCP